MRRRIALYALLCSMAAPGFTQTGSANYTAMWWNAAESGWGLNIAHQGDVLFPMWFTYDANGRIQWFAVSGAVRQADGRYTGEVFRYSGQPFNQIAGGQAFTTSSAVGTASLRFPSSNILDFSYTVDGISQNKSLVRFVFAGEPVCNFVNGSRANASNYTDIWWNERESGWGLTLAHQADSMFGLWYTYGASGAAQWVSAFGSKQADGSFRGDLNRATAGTAFGQINGLAATQFPLPKVGDFELRFSNGENGSFRYTLDGVTQTKPISRFVFGAPVSVCATPGNPEPGTAGGCVRKPQVGDVRSFRRSTGSGGITTASDTLTERVVGTTVLNEDIVLVRETFNSAGRRISRQLERVTATTLDVLLVDVYDAQTRALVSTTRFDPARRFPFNPAAGSTTETSYASVREEFLPVAATLNFTDFQRVRRLPDEAVSAPIGTYPSACKLELYQRSTLVPAPPAPPQPAPVYETLSTVWTLQTPGSIRGDQTRTESIGGSASVRTLDDTLSFQGGN